MRIAKIFLGCLAGVVLLFVLVLVGINIYLQSADVQSRIGVATAEAIGTPVEIERTLYLPWTGLILSGLSVADPLVANAKMGKAARFSVRFEFLPLLNRRFVINEITLSEPRIEIRQTPEGQWAFLPQEQADAPVSQENVPAAEKSATTARAQSQEQTGRQQPLGETAPPRHVAPPDPEYTVELDKIAVENGSLVIHDRRGRPILRINGLRLYGDVDQNSQLEGRLEIDEIVISDRIFAKKLRARFSRAGDKLTVLDIKSELAEGALRGELHAIAPVDGDPRFDLHVRLDEISVPDLIEEADGDSSRARGQLFGEMRIKGNPLDRKTLVGGGYMELTDAQLKPVGLFRQIGQLLDIDELMMLDLERATLKLDIRDENVWVNNLYLETANLIIAAEGPIDFNGEMYLDSRLLVNEKIHSQFKRVFTQNFEPSEIAGYRQLPFVIGGKLARPQTDLANRLVGEDVQKYLGGFGFLNDVFRAPERDKDGKN